MQIDFTPITSSKRYELDKKLLDLSGGQHARNIWLYILLTLSIIGIPYVIYRLLQSVSLGITESKERNILLNKFADKNGFIFGSNEGKFLTPEDLDNSLDLPFKTDHVTPINSLTGKMLGCNFSYSLSAVIINKSNFPSTIFAIDLPINLPRLFVNSKFNNLPGLDAEALGFTDSVNHVLEGDFPDYYTVRAEQNQHIDMYEVLTPEVMDLLVKNNHYDIWINGRQLMLITSSMQQAMYFAGIPQAFENAHLLMTEIDKIAREIRQQNQES